MAAVWCVMSDSDYHELSEERMPAFGAKMTKSEAGKKGASGRLRNTTPEQRSEIARRGGIARAKQITPEQRSQWGKLGGRPKKN